MEMPDSDQSVEFMNQAIVKGIANGMRASLESGNLLTGAKYISIDYFPGAGPAEMGDFVRYPTIPTDSSGLGQLQHQLSASLDKVNALPLEDTVASANSAMASLNANLQSLQKILDSQGTQQLPGEMAATLEEIRLAVSGLTPDSDLYQSLSSSLVRLNRSLGNLEALTRTLASQPNAAVMPSSAKPDPVPEVSQ